MDKQLLVQSMLAAGDFHVFSAALQQYLLLRLKLPKVVRENRIHRLVIFSVQMQMPNASPVFIEEKLAGTDCHQTSYVVKKKCLLMMEVEAALAVRLTDEQLDEVETIHDYALVLWHARKGKHDESCGNT